MSKINLKQHHLTNTIQKTIETKSKPLKNTINFKNFQTKPPIKISNFTRSQLEEH